MRTPTTTWQQRIARPLRQAVRYLRILAGIIALACVILALAVHVAAIRGIDVEAAWPDVWLLQAAPFPLLILAVVTAGVVAEQGGRLRFREFVALIPMSAQILLALGLIYAIAALLVFTSLAGAGAPFVKDGRFFFNDHGTIREVSEALFHFQRSQSVRLYSSVWLYLYLCSTVYLLGAKRKPTR